MPRKKSVKKAAQDFATEADALVAFLASASQGQTDEHVSWLHDYAIIRLYREFESLMLSALVGAVNNDTSTISATSGIRFPKHLTDEVCEYLITHGGYFDFKGRSGLIKLIKRFVPSNHYVLNAVKKTKYRTALERLSALRNFAAHESVQSKAAALSAIGAKRVGSAGSWLKRNTRFEDIATSLKDLAADIEADAPY